MDDSRWYDIVSDASLMQGDVLFACPVPTIIDPQSAPTATVTLDLNMVATNIVVMTQSCDLENEKTDLVLLARLSNWNAMARAEYLKGNTAIKSRDFRKKLIEGNIPGLSLLHKHDADPKLDWSVVDFHRLYTLPKAYLEQYAKSLGPRLRLRSPYREHLAQAFARYFMRVGLPHDAKAFEKEGDVPVAS